MQKYDALHDCFAALIVTMLLYLLIGSPAVLFSAKQLSSAETHAFEELLKKNNFYTVGSMSQITGTNIPMPIYSSARVYSSQVFSILVHSMIQDVLLQLKIVDWES
jgi:hypothetical protein